MAREYVVSGGGITLANQQVTAVFINPAAAQGFEVLRQWAGQTGTATSAQQRIQMNTQVTAFPTLTSATPAKTKFNDPASAIVGGTAGAAGTTGINASAEGAGAKTIIINDTFNNLNGYLWVPTPRELLAFSAGIASGYALNFPVAPGSLTNWQFGVTYGEIG
jgi:hypothetical protein